MIKYPYPLFVSFMVPFFWDFFFVFSLTSSIQININSNGFADAMVFLLLFHLLTALLPFISKISSHRIKFQLMCHTYLIKFSLIFMIQYNLKNCIWSSNCLFSNNLSLMIIESFVFTLQVCIFYISVWHHAANGPF